MFAGRPGPSTQCTFQVYRPIDHYEIRRNGELLLVLGLLFLLDIVTTQIILGMGGIELNPLMAGIVAHPALHLGIKAAILLLIFPLSLIAEQRVKGSSAVFYGVLITLYICIVINNIFAILPQIAM